MSAFGEIISQINSLGICTKSFRKQTRKDAAMIFGLFKKKNPPTKNQINLCNELGLAVSNSMSKADVSSLISESLKKECYLQRYNKLKGIDEAVDLKEDIEEYGEKIALGLRKWKKICDDKAHYLLAFKKGQKTYHDLVEFASVDISGARKYKLSIEIILPKKVKGSGAYYYDWDKFVTITPENILHLESINEELELFDRDKIEQYEKIVEGFKNRFIE